MKQLQYIKKVWLPYAKEGDCCCPLVTKVGLGTPEEWLTGERLQSTEQNRKTYVNMTKNYYMDTILTIIFQRLTGNLWG